jgi:hypothetical protein
MFPVNWKAAKGKLTPIRDTDCRFIAPRFLHKYSKGKIVRLQHRINTINPRDCYIGAMFLQRFPNIDLIGEIMSNDVYHQLNNKILIDCNNKKNGHAFCNIGNPNHPLYRG